MSIFFCTNCRNLKSRTIEKEHISAIKKDKINRALKEHDPDSLDLSFPFNLTVYKRITSHGYCKIFYCSEHMLPRDAYVDRDNSDAIRPEVSPCPKYC